MHSAHAYRVCSDDETNNSMKINNILHNHASVIFAVCAVATLFTASLPVKNVIPSMSYYSKSRLQRGMQPIGLKEMALSVVVQNGMKSPVVV